MPTAVLQVAINGKIHKFTTVDYSWSWFDEPGKIFANGQIYGDNNGVTDFECIEFSNNYNGARMQIINKHVVLFEDTDANSSKPNGFFFNPNAIPAAVP